MNFMNTFWKMEDGIRYSCSDFIVHRVNNELFVNESLLYTFYIHDSMGNKYKKGPVGKRSSSNDLSLEETATLLAALYNNDIAYIT